MHDPLFADCQVAVGEGEAATEATDVWVFFDENNVLSHYGATFAVHRAQYALPWEDVHEPEDHAKRDAARAESGR